VFVVRHHNAGQNNKIKSPNIIFGYDSQVKISGDGTDESKPHSRINQEQIKFGEYLMQLLHECRLLPSI
jgi:hypothetical protein